MIQITLPAWVSGILKKPVRMSEYTATELSLLKEKLSRFKCPHPLVSVVIPAWNEEEGILHTLHSLANSNTQYETELIVVDNNSTDGTGALLQSLGVQTIVENKQGLGNARTCGLLHAKGKYVLTGDSDTLYPAGWITAMTKAMIDGETDKVYCVHGTYSFIPSSGQRWLYACYEMMSSIVIKRKEKTQPFLNALGFNTGYVKQQGINVNGYDIEVQRTFRGQPGVVENNATEDGMMALRLQQAGGTIKAELSNDSRVWTSDRRIQMDGGLIKAFIIRLKKHLIKDNNKCHVNNTNYQDKSIFEKNGALVPDTH